MKTQQQVTLESRVDELELERIADEFLIENFAMELDVPIVLNGRLSKALGRHVYFRHAKETVQIELSKDLIRYYDDETVIDVLKHELVHHALLVDGLPHRDGEYYFEKTLKELGVSRTNHYSHKGKSHIYECTGCQNTFKEVRKFNTARYRCSRCQSQLMYVKQVIS